MRTVVALLLSVVLAGFVTAQTESKYVGQDEEGQIVLFIVDAGTRVAGALMPRYGVLLPFEAVRDGKRFRGELEGTEPTTGIEATLHDDGRLTLVLAQGDGRKTLELIRQAGRTVRPAANPPLEGMLALVPDGLAARTGSPGVSFVDFAAVERAAGVPAPASKGEFAVLAEAERDRWWAALRRVSAGPSELVMWAGDAMERLPELLGAEYFAIDAALGYGAPPATATLLAVEYEDDLVAGALGARGFELADRWGISVFHRGEDFATNLADRDTGDPFGAGFGRSQRIALLPGHLVSTPYWIGTDSIVRAATGAAPSLAQAPDYRTLAQAVADPATGELLQAVFLQTADVGLLPGDPFAALDVEPDGAEGSDSGAGRDGAEVERSPAASLPFYGLALLADKQDGDEQVAIAALLYEDVDTARQAAAVLARRLLAFSELGSPEVTLRAEPSVYETDFGLVAAVVAIRTPARSRHRKRRHRKRLRLCSPGPGSRR